MNNTLSETLYSIYVPVALHPGIKPVDKNTRVMIEQGVGYELNTFLSILVVSHPVTGRIIGEVKNMSDEVADSFEALNALKLFNPAQSPSILIALDDIDILFPEKRVEGVVCYSDRELCFIRLDKQIAESDVDELFEDPCNTGYDDQLDLLDLIDHIDSKEKEAKKEEKPMNNLFGNLGFGKLKSDRYKLSMNGIAIAQANGKYVVYNKENNEFVDVTEMLFDIKDALFSLPTVEIAEGDIILHNDKPYYIVDATNDIKAVSYEDCTQTVLIPRTTMFGLKFFTKIFSMFGNIAESGEIFSNPLMLMTLMSGEGSNDLSKMLMLSSLTKGELGTNPMMLAMMLKDGDDKSDLSTLAMMSMFTGGTNPFAPSKTARNLNSKKPVENPIKE